MFRIFTRSWGVFFYSLLAVMLCGGYEVAACIGGAANIKAPGSTFTSEEIVAARTYQANPAFTINFGATEISHNGTCWFYHGGSKCLDKWKADQKAIGASQGNFNPVHVTIDKGRGRIEYNNQSKKLQVYSAYISPSGEVKIDSNKPYLEFHVQNIDCKKCNLRYSYDGCNTCGVLPNGDTGGCTRMGCTNNSEKANACAKYEIIKASNPSCKDSKLTVTAYTKPNGAVMGRFVDHNSPDGARPRGSSFGGTPGSVTLSNNALYSGNACSVIKER